MILLDTNVVSEAMRATPNASVLEWLDRQNAETLFLSSITIAELMFGLRSLPEGKRKDLLAATLDGLLALFGERILPFDTHAARCFATLAVKARSEGQGFSTADGYIAAIAASRDFVVATRDTTPFVALGVDVINPWQSR